MTRPTLTVIFAISFITLVAVAALSLILIEQVTVGDVDSIEASLRKPAVPTTTSPSSEPAEVPGSTGEDARPPAPAVPVRPGLVPDSAPDDPAVPLALKLESIGIDAPIIPMGVNQQTGQMAVPDNVREVAWYEFGPRPGEAGSAVLAAHVDLASQGPGVFFDLKELGRGDLIEVEFSDGEIARFRVEARTTYQKDELPLETIFAQEGASVLTLVTCGGGFSESAGSYDSNVVVYAVPVPERDLSEAG